MVTVTTAAKCFVRMPSIWRRNATVSCSHKYVFMSIDPVSRRRVQASSKGSGTHPCGGRLRRRGDAERRSSYSICWIRGAKPQSAVIFESPCDSADISLHESRIAISPRRALSHACCSATHPSRGPIRGRHHPSRYLGFLRPTVPCPGLTTMVGTGIQGCHAQPMQREGIGSHCLPLGG